jgi:hypothetical protein
VLPAPSTSNPISRSGPSRACAHCVAQPSTAALARWAEASAGGCDARWRRHMLLRARPRVGYRARSRAARCRWVRCGLALGHLLPGRSRARTRTASSASCKAVWRATTQLARGRATGGCGWGEASCVCVQLGVPNRHPLVLGGAEGLLQCEPPPLRWLWLWLPFGACAAESCHGQASSVFRAMNTTRSGSTHPAQ